MKRAKHDCDCCAVELQNPSNTCAECQRKPPFFFHVSYACLYQNPVDKWIKSLKFGNNILISRLFAEIMSLHVNINHQQILMPVPLHNSRLRRRGYNQAYEITKAISQITDIDINTSLRRIKNTAMQAQLKLNQRADNVKNAFAVKISNKNQTIKDKRIVLIDDVMTSGNTLNECAKTLIKAGVKDVSILVFARKSL